ncbi:MAG: IS110 family transposase [Solirubrobacteraceae bacterium]
MTIGIDPHKDTHQAVAVDALGKLLAERAAKSTGDGFGALLEWAHGLGGEERLWVLEDCRHVSGALERFLLDRGERVARLAPHLMAQARTHVGTRGKSDPIDALAVARAALAHGPERLPTARLAGIELDIRLVHPHHQRLVRQRTALINDLRWNMHDLWPELTIPRRQLTGLTWQARLARKLASAPQSTRVRIARDELRRVRELTRAIHELVAELATLVSQAAPQLLAHTGFGPITAAALISEIAGIDRFQTDAKLARTAGCAPIPVSSGRTDRHRLDRGGNRRLNHVVHMIAITRIGHDPKPPSTSPKQRKAGKTQREAIRSLKRHLIRRIWRLLTDPTSVPTTVCLT